MECTNLLAGEDFNWSTSLDKALKSTGAITLNMFWAFMFFNYFTGNHIESSICLSRRSSSAFVLLFWTTISSCLTTTFSWGLLINFQQLACHVYLLEDNNSTFFSLATVFCQDLLYFSRICRNRTMNLLICRKYLWWCMKNFQMSFAYSLSIHIPLFQSWNLLPKFWKPNR